MKKEMRLQRGFIRAQDEKHWSKLGNMAMNLRIQ
jgi:hypothetical protein